MNTELKNGMTLEQFKKYVKKNDANLVSDTELVKDQRFRNNFIIICKKCSSLNIEFSEELGIDYGGQTGYDAGEKGFKCVDCGNAITWYA